jgi:hypothetical protein
VFALLVGIALGISGCGTYVPEIQEASSDQSNGQLLVHAIVRSIHCEIRNAIAYVIDEDKRLAPLNGGVRSAEWLEGWGAQVGLSLTTEEKTALNPTSAWSPPSPAKALFALGLGVNLSSDATRIDKFNYYYTVADLYKQGACAADQSPHPTGSLLIQSDLKLREWLLSQVLNVGTGESGVPTSANTLLKQNALSHEVKFEVVSTGSLTPSWKLVNVTVNQTGTFFSTTRDRTHDLLITFGPTDPNTPGLSGAAYASYLASQIGLAISEQVKSGISP